MNITSYTTKWQVYKIVEILEGNGYKPTDEEFQKHLVMFGESRANAKIQGGEDFDDFVENYCRYWRLKCQL